MKATRLAIPEVVLLQPKVFGDERGFFYESFNQQRFEEAIGRSVPFVQDNHSCSAKGVLRGLHYQVQQPQGKLVRVTAGEVFDDRLPDAAGKPGGVGQQHGRPVASQVPQRQRQPVG